MNGRTSPLTYWAEALQQWAIPEHILAQAPQSPWIHPVENFRPQGNLFVDVPSRLRALEALPPGGSVLDIGCGGGRATFGLVPPAGKVVGVDHQQGMLDVFSEEARTRGVQSEVFLGDWPNVAEQTPVCDVVICHHVFYNVQSLEPFVRALDSHATKRVVVELPLYHPLSSLSDLWLRFWNLERPATPTAHDALAVVQSLGMKASIELFEVETVAKPITPVDVEHTRIRLCLPGSKDAEIAEALGNRPNTPRQLATIWW